MADPIVPTRNQIAALVGNDPAMIKALERLFIVAGTLTPADIVTLTQLILDNSYATGAADNKADVASSEVIAVARMVSDVSYAASSADNKAEVAMAIAVAAEQMASLAATQPILQEDPRLGMLGSMAFQDANAVSITGGTIDGTVIGGSSAAAGAFTTVTASGQASFADGTALLPSITNTGDTNAGVFFPAADTVAITTNGGERFRIASVGQIGIGGANYGTSGQTIVSAGAAAAPAWGTLPVAGGGTGVTTSTGTVSVVLSASPALTGNVTVTSNSANAAVTITQTGAGASFVVEDSASPDATPFIVDASGSVGIGTSSPAKPLSISASEPMIQLVDSNLPTRVANIGGQNGNVIIDIDPAAAAAASLFSVNIDNIEYLRVASAGQVGLSGANYGTSGQSIISAGSAAAPAWGAIGVAGGGTGIASYTIGDIVYASGVTTLSKLADVAVGNALISGGVGVAPSYGKIGLTTHVSGVLPVANGGTNQSAALTQYGMIYGNTTTSMASTAAGTSTTLLHGNASGAPTWSAVSLTADVSGTLPVANGGTNITSYTIGDLIYASTAGVLSALADAATGNALISGGVGAAPSYGKIGLTTHVTGTLPVANGGTNIATYTTGDILYASTAGVLTPLADVATGNAIISGGVGAAPSYGKIILSTAGSHVTGTLPVANGGTGQASNLTQYGVVYGSTTTAMATSAAGTTTQVLHGNAAGAPTFGAVSLTADVSGTLPVANGGTGVVTSTGTGSVVLSASPALTGNVTVSTNSATAALQITQIGAGPAFLVEDSASVDATPFIIDASGNVGIGNTAPVTPLHVTGASITTGVVYRAQAAQTSKAAAATLTIAELLTGIIQYTGAAATLTLPTGTNIEGGLPATFPTNMSFDVSFINTGAALLTIGANGNTTVGTMTVATVTSAMLRFRKTAANTYTVYRIS